MSFFEVYPTFDHDDTASIKCEFDRLAKQQRWTKKQTERFRAICYEEELSDHMLCLGISTPLAQLQHLCEEIGIDIPTTITQCKKALSKVNVNVVDLMDARRKHEVVKVFVSYKALKKYTKKTGRFCPREAAKTDGTRTLLKHITQF